jgi:hypothetical protein
LSHSALSKSGKKTCVEKRKRGSFKEQDTQKVKGKNRNAFWVGQMLSSIYSQLE